MKWLVFSKDRPYQLDAFIRTAVDNGGIRPSDISVLYRYTEGFADVISTLMQEHPEVEFIEQSSFREDVMRWLISGESSIISFATDDALFTRKVPVDLIESILVDNPDVTTFTLRMGLHLDHCYPTDSAQRIPDGKTQGGVFVWNANNSEGDWGYPLSVDGHVFRREIVLWMLSSFAFDSPNSLESNWQLLRHAVSPHVCCLPKSCYFNVPINRVQETHKNRCGCIDPNELLAHYKFGARLPSKRFMDFINTSAHQEVKIT